MLEIELAGYNASHGKLFLNRIIVLASIVLLARIFCRRRLGLLRPLGFHSSSLRQRGLTKVASSNSSKHFVFNLGSGFRV
jgi:predicted xylose isomerase-like sugar epimerase